MERTEIHHWLLETDSGRLERLWLVADSIRKEHVGDAVHLRGLVELTNFCARKCRYCGINAENKTVDRYRMTEDEVLSCAHKAVELGFGTLVCQGGEDYGIQAEWMARVIRRIKAETPLAVTLSLGERSIEELEMWREAGADRYLLRFETSNEQLYEKIHPSLPGKKSDRLAILRELKTIGYEVGSGVMVGIPGQSYLDLADDIVLFRELDLDMIGVGPYIPHPETQMGRNAASLCLSEDQQVPNDAVMTCKTMALTRMVCPDTNIPATTALATISRENGRELGLKRGANVLMPNLISPEYRAQYEIYPGKACLAEDDEFLNGDLRKRIESIGRFIATGPGFSPNWSKRTGKQYAVGQGDENER